MTTPTGTRPPGRPRSETTRRAILETSANLLDNEPFGRISIERIAAEAKVGKQSIYRWWDSKADVLLDAFTDRALRRLPVHKSEGDAFRDLEKLMKLFFTNVREPSIRKTLTGLIAEAQLDPEFRAKFHSVFVATRRAMIREVIARGIERRQFRSDLDIELTIDILYGGFWYRLLSGSADQLDDAFAGDLVRTLRPSMEPTLK